MQLIWCALGLVLCVVAAPKDYRLIEKLAWPSGIAGVLLRWSMAPHIGRKITGETAGSVSAGESHAFRMGKDRASSLSLAWYGEHFQRDADVSSAAIFMPGIIYRSSAGADFQSMPDRGSTLLLACFCTGMLLVERQNKFILWQ